MNNPEQQKETPLLCFDCEECNGEECLIYGHETYDFTEVGDCPYFTLREK